MSHHGNKQDNLSKTQRTALKQLKNDEKMKVYPFDKGIGFALLNDIDSISKTEEQLGKSMTTQTSYQESFKGISENLKKKANLIKRRTQ